MWLAVNLDSSLYEAVAPPHSSPDSSSKKESIVVYSCSLIL